MSQKAPLPSLTGHRLKTRKRDEKKAYDPQGFRDAILEGLDAAGKFFTQMIYKLMNSNRILMCCGSQVMT